jgi:hypothetical protein
MVDSTDFRTGDNENAVSILDCHGRLFKKAANEAAGETKPEAYPLGYVEDFVEPRTKLGAFFSSLTVRRFFDSVANAPPTRRQIRERRCRDCLYR